MSGAETLRQEAWAVAERSEDLLILKTGHLPDG